VEVDELLDQLTVSGHKLAVAAGSAGLDRPVPTCPGWTISELVEHTYRVHSWAAHAVRGRPAETFSIERPEPSEVLARYEQGLDDLVKAVRGAREAADPAARPPGTSRFFWSRRMAHETTVHWLDAELAADTGMVDIPTTFAADGLDELVLGFAPSSFSPAGVSPPLTITIMPLDVNRAWTVTVTAHGVRSADIATDHADLTVSGMAGDLYRWAWNRGHDDEVSLSGMIELADVWHRNFVVADRR
jgi:uncharacterized protein (TIGR03083 family)